VIRDRHADERTDGPSILNGRMAVHLATAAPRLLVYSGPTVGLT